MPAKELLWVGSARADLRALPDAARRQLGYDLRLVQSGGEPRDWKPMGTVGPGTEEVRVRVDGIFRVLYVAKFPEGVYVLHAFQKKSQQTAKLDLDLARARYAVVVRTRAKR